MLLKEGNLEQSIKTGIVRSITEPSKERRFTEIDTEIGEVDGMSYQEVESSIRKTMAEEGVISVYDTGNGKEDKVYHLDRIYYLPEEVEEDIIEIDETPTVSLSRYTIAPKELSALDWLNKNGNRRI